ncbi:MAG: ankyrin repeat domain-containing protein [Gammaproteobacteria bacterium]|nr:ankyrin repeat domain-containing protein [Gammaproteobacteria bacterium]
MGNFIDFVIAALRPGHPEKMPSATGGESSNTRELDKNYAHEVAAFFLAAASSDDPLRIREIVKSGIDVDVRGDLDWTPLMKACSSNPNLSVINELIDLGANVNEMTRVGYTPLGNAAYSNPNPSLISLLIGCGADVDCPSGEMVGPPLLRAFFLSSNKSYRKEIVEALLSAGADVNACDSSESTPLMIFCQRFKRLNDDKWDVLKLLLDAGADVNASDNRGVTALMNAVSDDCNLGLVRALLAVGADAHPEICEEKGGGSALVCANYRTSNIEILKILVNSGANINGSGEDGKTPLMRLADAFKWNEKAAESIEVLIKLGANVHSIDKRGWTALMYAVHQGIETARVKNLLDGGSNPKAQNHAGKTAIDYAKRDSEIFHLLEEASN